MKQFKCVVPAHKKDLPNQEPVTVFVETKFKGDCGPLVKEELTKLGFNADHFKNAKISPATVEELEAYIQANVQTSVDPEGVEGEIASTGVTSPELLAHQRFNRLNWQFVEPTGKLDANQKPVQHYALCRVIKADEGFYTEHGYMDLYVTNKCGKTEPFETYKEAATHVIKYMIALAGKSISISNDHKDGDKFCFRAHAHFSGIGANSEFNDSDFIASNAKLAESLGLDYFPEKQLDIVDHIAEEEAAEEEDLKEMLNGKDPEVVHENKFSSGEIAIIENFPTPSTIQAHEDYQATEEDIQEIKRDKSVFIEDTQTDVKNNTEKYENFYNNGFAALSDIDTAIDSKEVALSRTLRTLHDSIAVDIYLLGFAKAYKIEPVEGLVSGAAKAKLGSLSDIADKNLEKIESNTAVDVDIDLDVSSDLDVSADLDVGIDSENVDQSTGEITIDDDINVEADIDIEVDIEVDIDKEAIHEIVINDEVVIEADFEVVEYKATEKVAVSEVAADSLVESLIPVVNKPKARKVAKFKEGVYEGVIDEDYHADDSESSTNIKQALKSGMFYQNNKNGTIPRAEKKVFDLGKLIHAMLLEPETVKDRFIVTPTEPRKPTKVQVEAYQKGTATDKAVKSVEFWAAFDKEKEAKGLVSCTKDDWKLAENMRAAAYADKDCAPLLTHTLAKREVSHFKIDQETGIMMKVRPDLSVAHICLDVKSVELWGNPDSESLEAALTKEIMKRGYHVSAAMYNEIGDFSQFAWIFVNKTEGYHWCALVVASPQMLKLGKLKYIKGKRIIAECVNKGIYNPPVIEPFIAELDSYGRAELERLESEV